MDNLKKEYTDIKNIKHKVEHTIASGNDTGNRERVIEELLHALTRTFKHDKRIPT